jgi:arsenite/tail-anchored protein-transporting ATPase
MIPAPAPVLLFTGKGGVGKTSVACATAVRLADAGKRVLLVSTDPASNLDEVLGVDLSGGDPVPVPRAPGLQAQNIDPEEAARRYRERVVGPFRGVLPDAAVASIEEQLSGACTVEIAAFDRFARLLGDPSSAGFDQLVFDTAPTGHTLRLLELPAAWTGFLDTNTTGTSCLGPLSGLEAERAAYARALETLRDPERAQVVLVARPDQASLREAARAATELGALGIVPGRLVVNAVPRGLDPRDPVAEALMRQAEDALAALPPELARTERVDVPLSPVPPLGLDGIRALGSAGTRAAAGEPVDVSAPRMPREPGPSGFRTLESLLDDLESPGRGVILTMGKGGVGKTTVAVALAEGLARRGHRVHLTTTDPAAHVFDAVTGDVSGLRVSRIDPEAETRAYTAEVMALPGGSLDAAGRALLEEDLRSPCTEEIAVFRAFAAAVAGGEDEIVVIDTAPTGHTLLLMDAAEAYHREVLRKPGSAPEAVLRLLPRLRDPAFARVLLVTLPEATPVHEAARLQADLERAGIHPFAWVVNQCLTPLDLSDAMLRRRRAAEGPYLHEVRPLSANVIVVPFLVPATVP